VADSVLSEQQIRELLAEYLTLLQSHPSAEEMMAAVLTDDFETGFQGGKLWKGIDGLRDFLSQRDGFFDESHRVKDLLEADSPSADEVHAKTRLEFFLRRWEAPSPTSEEFTGSCFHTWRLRREPDRWRVAAQIVDRFADLNESSKRLFATPDEGLNRPPSAAR
jgi:hypothetical protein